MECTKCNADLSDLDSTEYCFDKYDDAECISCEETKHLLYENEKRDINPNFGKPFSKNPVAIYCGNGVTKYHKNGKKHTSYN